MTDTITADSAYVTYDQFDPNKLGGESPKGDSFTDENNQKITFANMAHFYNYGTESQPIVTDCYIELPPMKARGILTKEEEKKKRDGDTYMKVSHSQMIIFDLSDPEQKKAIETLNQAHTRCSTLLGTTAWARENDFNPERPGGLFKNPVYWPKDSVTKEIQEGKNPSMFIKLKGGFNKPLFTTVDAEGNVETIDWALLRNVDIEYIPLLHLERTFIGNKATLQIFLQSAIVLDIKEANSTSRQVSTIDRLREKYGDKFKQQQENVQSSLAQLRMARQDQLLAENIGSNPLPNNSEDLTGDNGQTDTNNSPKSNADNMTAFLSAAPPMPTQVSLPTAVSQTHQGLQTGTQQGTQQGLQQPGLNVQPGPSLNVQGQRVVLS